MSSLSAVWTKSILRIQSLIKREDKNRVLYISDICGLPAFSSWDNPTWLKITRIILKAQLQRIPSSWDHWAEAKLSQDGLEEVDVFLSVAESLMSEMTEIVKS